MLWQTAVRSSRWAQTRQLHAADRCLLWFWEPTSYRPPPGAPAPLPPAARSPIGAGASQPGPDPLAAAQGLPARALPRDSRQPAQVTNGHHVGNSSRKKKPSFFLWLHTGKRDGAYPRRCRISHAVLNLRNVKRTYHPLFLYLQQWLTTPVLQVQVLCSSTTFLLISLGTQSYNKLLDFKTHPCLFKWAGLLKIACPEEIATRGERGGSERIKIQVYVKKKVNITL